MGEMNESQKAVMNLLSKEPKPDVGHAETLLDLAKATKLPPRVLGQIETYIKAGNEAGRLASEAKEAQKAASNVWDGVRDAASRTDDLVDLANEAAEEEGDEEDEGDKGEAPAAEQTKPARSWAKGQIVGNLTGYLIESREFREALEDASLDELEAALLENKKDIDKRAGALAKDDADAVVAIVDRIKAKGGKVPAKVRDLDAEARKLVLDGKVAKIVEEAQAKPAGTIPATTAATPTTPADPKTDPLAGLKGLDRAKEQGRIAALEAEDPVTIVNPYLKGKNREAFDEGTAEVDEAMAEGREAWIRREALDTNPFLGKPGKSTLAAAWTKAWEGERQATAEDPESNDPETEEAGD